MTNFQRYANEVAELVGRKNTDYGSAFDKLMNEHSDYFVIRLKEKIMRFEQVSKHGAKVQDEAIQDTVKDIIGYCLLFLNYQESSPIHEDKKSCGDCLQAVATHMGALIESPKTPTVK